MRLGAVAPTPATDTAIYAPAVGVTGAVNVFVANRGAPVARVRIIHRPGAGPTVDTDYLAFNEAIGGNEGRRSGVINIANPEELLVRTDITGVTFQVNGIERSLTT